MEIVRKHANNARIMLARMFAEFLARARMLGERCFVCPMKIMLRVVYLCKSTVYDRSQFAIVVS